MVSLPPQNQPRLLTEAQVEIIRRAWAEGLRRDDVARLAGITMHVLEARRHDQLADLPPRPKGVGGGHRAWPPSEIEIRLMTYECRQRWTPERWLNDLPENEQPLGLRGPPR
jgi:hypothetical protein